MSINKNHPNYTKSPALKGRVVLEGRGRNRAGRRGAKSRNTPKQFHLTTKAQVRMMFKEKGLIKK